LGGKSAVRINGKGTSESEDKYFSLTEHWKKNRKSLTSYQNLGKKHPGNSNPLS